MDRELLRFRRDPLKDPPSSPTLWNALSEITELKSGQRAQWRIIAVMFGLCAFALLLHLQHCGQQQPESVQQSHR